MQKAGKQTQSGSSALGLDANQTGSSPCCHDSSLKPATPPCQGKGKVVPWLGQSYPNSRHTIGENNVEFRVTEEDDLIYVSVNWKIVVLLVLSLLLRGVYEE